jgi:H/ACA ribonucleoprotein complex subunit 2
VVILAGDVSPIDVISHIPILCEQKGLAYCYVRSRMELGAAAGTKKPTSVILMTKSNDIKKASKLDRIQKKLIELNPYV